MIVCHCNALRESDVRAVARQCRGGVEQAYARLGCKVQCGGCVDYAEELLCEENQELLAA